MTVRRLVSVLSVCLVASATVVAAQPKKQPAPAKAKGAPAAPAPAKDAPPAPAPDAAAGSAAGSGSGSAVEMTEDPPPSDMEGTNENPDAPRGTNDTVVVAPVVKAAPRAGYPIEEALRPITLPQNMSEVSLDAHAQIDPYAGASTLRARYGITRQIQLGLSYLIGGVYAAKDFGETSGSTKFHPGKAVGLDVTVLLTNWVGVKVGVPVYVNPLALSLSLGAPMKFVFTDKFAIGGLDDLLNIRIKRFPPSFYQEAQNAGNKAADESHTTLSRGQIRISIYGIYQQSPKLAIIGRAGLNFEDLGSGKTNIGDTTSFLRAGLQYSVRKSVDVGGSLGFDDLAHNGSFAPAAYLAIRI